MKNKLRMTVYCFDQGVQSVTEPFFVHTGKEVFYLDCTNIPLEHVELIIREVYLPLLCTNQQNLASSGGDKVMDVLHRLMSVVEVSQGHAEVKLYLLCFVLFISCFVYNLYFYWSL